MLSLVPVTPREETQYKKPVAVSHMAFIRSPEVGATKAIKSTPFAFA